MASGCVEMMFNWNYRLKSHAVSCLLMAGCWAGSEHDALAEDLFPPHPTSLPSGMLAAAGAAGRLRAAGWMVPLVWTPCGVVGTPGAQSAMGCFVLGLQAPLPPCSTLW